LWDTTTGRELAVFKNDLGAAGALAVSPTGNLLALSEEEGGIRIWDTALSKVALVIPVPRTWVKLLAWSPDGQRLLASGDDGPVCEWDPPTGRKTRELERLPGRPLSLAFAPDSKSLAVGCADGKIHLFDAGSRTARPVLGRIDGGVFGLAYSPDGSRLISLGFDRICVWTTETGRQLWAQEERSWIPRSACFTTDGAQVVAVADSGRVRTWDADTGRLVRSVPGKALAFPFLAVALGPGGKTFATGGALGEIQIWDTATGRPCARGLPPPEPVTLAFAADGRTLLALTRDGALSRWDLISGRLRNDSLLACGHLLTASFSADGKLLATTAERDPLRLWDTATGRLLHELEDGPCATRALTFTPDAQVLAAAGDEGLVRRWHALTGKPQPWSGETERAVRLLAFAPDGRSLAVVGSDHALRIHGATTGKVKQRLPELKQALVTAVFSPDGRLLLALFEQQLLVWDVASGKQLWRSDPQIIPWLRAAWTRDSRTILAVDRCGAVTLWEAATGQVRLWWRSRQEQATALAVAPDGRRAALGGADATILVFDLLRLDAEPGQQAEQASPGLLWAALASPSAQVSWQAICTLARTPQPSLAFLSKKLRPWQPATTPHLHKLLAQLDAEEFENRERATEELIELLDQVGSLLEDLLKKDDLSVEARQRIRRILDRRGAVGLSSELLQPLRAIEALEWMHTPEAKALLEKLAGGAADAWRTRQAKAALDRWER
jgi:WD40 repeat protein